MAVHHTYLPLIVKKKQVNVYRSKFSLFGTFVDFKIGVEWVYTFCMHFRMLSFFFPFDDNSDKFVLIQKFVKEDFIQDLIRYN